MVDSVNRYGIYCNGIGELKCLNNTIQNRFLSTVNNDGSGIYMNSSSTPASRKHEISNNYITNAETYGIYISSSNTLAAPNKSIITNNIINGGFRNSSASGLYLYSLSGNSFWDIIHNTIVLDNIGSSSTSSAFNVLISPSGSQLDVRTIILL